MIGGMEWIIIIIAISIVAIILWWIVKPNKKMCVKCGRFIKEKIEYGPHCGKQQE